MKVTTIKCDVCGCEFVPVAEKHYIARDCCKTGIAVTLVNNEEKLYDAFDCQLCGCQVIAKERKRSYIPCNELDDEEMEALSDE